MNAQDTRNELLRQSRIALKKKCKSLRMSAEGSKSDIIKRIMIEKYGYDQLSENTQQELRIKRQKYLQERIKEFENEPDHKKKQRISIMKKIQKRTSIGKHVCYIHMNEKAYMNILHPSKSYILNKSNCSLLVTGYIRHLDKFINSIIPNDIVTLCLSTYFKNVFQILPPYRVHNELCCVDEEDKIFTTTGSSRYCTKALTFAIFTTPWKEGIHELQFECIHDGGNPIGIGMVTNVNADCKGWLFDRPESHLSYQLYSSRLFHENGLYCYQNGVRKSFEETKEMVSDGVVISMIVDFNKWTIRYYLNAIQVGDPMEIVKNKIYYPAITYKTWKRSQYNNCLKYRLRLYV